MRWLENFTLIMRSNLAALREKIEDPERMIHQLIIDMDEELEAEFKKKEREESLDSEFEELKSSALLQKALRASSRRFQAAGFHRGSQRATSRASASPSRLFAAFASASSLPARSFSSKGSRTTS